MSPALPVGRESGTLLLLAPHFDDEILGCGGLLAALEDKSRVRIVFACDGRGSADLRPPRGSAPGPELSEARAAESKAALDLLGIKWEQVRRLDFPDGSLAAREPELRGALKQIAREVNPQWVLAPFRFDRHADHMALSRAARALPAVADGRAALLEYFVYTRWRLFPGGDVRNVVKPGLPARLDLGENGFLKRRALDSFVTQTTCRESWQVRPVLTEALLREVSAGPEWFLAAPAGASDQAVLRWPLWRVRLVAAVEPRLKRMMFRLKRMRRMRRRPGS